MDLSFVCQLNAMIWMAKNGKGLKPAVYEFPEELDKHCNDKARDHGFQDRQMDPGARSLCQSLFRRNLVTIGSHMRSDGSTPLDIAFRIPQSIIDAGGVSFSLGLRDTSPRAVSGQAITHTPQPIHRFESTTHLPSRTLNAAN